MATESAGKSFWESIGQLQSSIPQTVNLTVDKDNVLQAAKIIQDTVDTHRQAIDSGFRMLAITPPGQDPVSVQAANQWRQKLLHDSDSYQARVLQYLETLNTLVTNLKTSAKQYGYTEQQIADAVNQSGTSGG